MNQNYVYTNWMAQNLALMLSDFESSTNAAAYLSTRLNGDTFFQNESGDYQCLKWEIHGYTDEAFRFQLALGDQEPLPHYHYKGFLNYVFEWAEKDPIRMIGLMEIYVNIFQVWTDQFG